MTVYATALTYTFTTREEIERTFSTIGVHLRVDDLTPAEQDDMFDEICGMATEEVRVYCMNRYADTELKKSFWIRRHATIIGCHLLSQRRGNPAQFAALYDRTTVQLQKVLEAKIYIPGLAVLAHNAPAQSNVVVDDRYTISKIRVQPAISSQPPHSNQRLDVPISPYE